MKGNAELRQLLEVGFNKPRRNVLKCIERNLENITCEPFCEIVNFNIVLVSFKVEALSAIADSLV